MRFCLADLSNVNPPAMSASVTLKAQIASWAKVDAAKSFLEFFERRPYSIQSSTPVEVITAPERLAVRSVAHMEDK